MSISEKVQAIEEVFSLLDREIATFRNWSGLACLPGCGKCCLKPDIEATVLEFLPLAHHLYHSDQALTWLDKLKQADAAVCLAFNPSQLGGMCTQYTHRGLICRLFGFSARTNKYARRELVTCQPIKSDQAGLLAEAVKGIDNGRPVPMMNHYYMRLHAIDADLARNFYPINEAIRRAIETVLQYYAYRD